METELVNGTRKADDRAAAIVVDGELTRETAEWLEALAIRRLADGDRAVIVECAAGVRVSGHLLGSLRRIAVLAAHRDAVLGVVAERGLGEILRAHSRNVSVATTWPRLLKALNVTCEPASIVRVGATAGGVPERTLWWTRTQRRCA